MLSNQNLQMTERSAEIAYASRGQKRTQNRTQAPGLPDLLLHFS